MGNESLTGTEHYNRWQNDAQARATAANPLNIPYDVFVREAAALAAFCDRRWEPSAGVPGLKGLSRLPATVAADLRSQLRGLQEAQTRLLMAVDPV
ncbi:MAG: hypothetical protein IT373_33220, partial [Polyangiaceae bacterium]|nr:hypothetical protein [Polyangiaceae bacterium]